MVERDNYDSVWLTLGQKNPTYTKFDHSPMRERAGTRDSVKAALKSAVVDHHKPARLVAGLLKKHGFEKASRILTSQLPRSHKTRMGNFGEVISSEHLRQRYGYTMPVFKLRYAEHFGLSTRGEDILGFELNAMKRIFSICLGEAKALGQFNSSTVKSAHERLANAFNPFPVSLSLIANILYEREDFDLADQVERIIARLAFETFPRTNWIFIICAAESQVPFDTIEEKSDVVKNLSCVDVYLPELQDLVNEIFNSPLSRRGQ